MANNVKYTGNHAIGINYVFLYRDNLALKRLRQMAIEILTVLSGTKPDGGLPKVKIKGKLNEKEVQAVYFSIIQRGYEVHYLLSSEHKHFIKPHYETLSGLIDLYERLRRKEDLYYIFTNTEYIYAFANHFLKEQQKLVSDATRKFTKEELKFLRSLVYVNDGEILKQVKDFYEGKPAKAKTKEKAMV